MKFDQTFRRVTPTGRMQHKLDIHVQAQKAAEKRKREKMRVVKLKLLKERKRDYYASRNERADDE